MRSAGVEKQVFGIYLTNSVLCRIGSIINSVMIGDYACIVPLCIYRRWLR